MYTCNVHVLLNVRHKSKDRARKTVDNDIIRTACIICTVLQYSDCEDVIVFDLLTM